MDISNTALPDYVCLDDVAANHPEPKLLIASQANANQALDDSDREIQRLLNNLNNLFWAGSNLFDGR
ncbi:hypothetical protein [Nostoc sp.]|uniref:hypothetical protein n=1 Tax=Nostoc sp. TaxID=1180 RepID=UPI002FF5CB7D